MTKATTISFDSPSFELDINSLDEALLENLVDLASPGDRYYNTKWFVEHYGVTADRDIAVDLLEPYGAWENDELTDHDENVIRLVWLLAGWIKDEQLADGEAWDGWVIMEGN